jgi:GNAT superfamily N-acetyltransferase
MREAALVEEHHARWILEHAGLPGREVHADGDAVWETSDGAAWANGGTRFRFRDDEVAERLTQITARFRELKRPAGFWVSELSTPADLAARLSRLGFRCRKHFPAMWCDLRRLPRARAVAGLGLERVTDHGRFQREAHPYIGRISTPLRRSHLDAQRRLTEQAPERVVSLLATMQGSAVGAAVLFLDGDCAGLWDVGVLESHRKRGIGTALTAHACALARDAGYHDCVLIASGMGYTVYRAVGFAEVCRMSYWYSRLGRDEPAR